VIDHRRAVQAVVAAVEVVVTVDNLVVVNPSRMGVEFRALVESLQVYLTELVI
jgi:hypothetical protein